MDFTISTTFSHSPSYDTLGLARVILETVIIIIIALEPVKNAYLKTFVKSLLVAFLFEECLIIAEATVVIYMGKEGEAALLIWRIYEITRIFISLSLCYPMSLFIGEDTTKSRLQGLFFAIASLVIVGGISDHLRYNNGHSGLNLVAFMLIFCFTFRQYMLLRNHSEHDVPRLNSLMVIEGCLIGLNALVIVFFYSGISNEYSYFYQAIKLAIAILQYHKIYMMISVMTYFV